VSGATEWATDAPEPVVLAGARLPAHDRPVDVLLAGGLVRSITPAGSQPVDAGVRTIPLDGRYVIPGLYDRHVHFSQWALEAGRIDLSGAGSAADVQAIVRAAIDRGEREVTGVAYRDGMWPDAKSRALLDAVSGETPVVLVSTDLHSCWLNTAALRRHGADHLAGDDGVLREGDCFRLLTAINSVDDDRLDALAGEAALNAAARGVVGITDYEMRWNRDDWARRVAGGIRSLRIAFGVYTWDLERAIAEGLRTGDEIAGTGGLVTVGGYKVITDGSLNTRTAWCFDPYPGLEGHSHPHGLATVSYDELVPLMRGADAAGITPAVHAIGDRANAAVLDAFEEVGCRGSIEHAQLLRHDDVARFAALGIVASVQPEHAMDDRDVADRYWAGRTDRAFMLADLAAAGVELALGSDAPVAPLDPWVAISAAVGRARDGREPWHPEQAIEASAALAASTGGQGAEVRVGGPADLAVVELDPLVASVDDLRRMPVDATLLGGRFTHGVR
jgi:predicted amidohydrolase YtcJ